MRWTTGRLAVFGKLTWAFRIAGMNGFGSSASLMLRTE